MFKIYKNKRTRHPAVSIKTKDNKHWYNMTLTHTKPANDTSIEVNDPHPLANPSQKSYVRRYVAKDKKSIKGHRYRTYKFSKESELKIKVYLKRKYKKR